MEIAFGHKNVTMDSMFVDFLNSTGPTPTQDSIDRVLGKMTRVKVLDGGMIGDKAMEGPVLLDCTDAISLEKLRSALAIKENPDPLNHCMCCGYPTLEIYEEDQRIATLGIHHGHSIRWSAWKQDADFQDGFDLMQWLVERGITGPMKEFEIVRAEEEKLKKDIQLWFEAMPPCFQPFWPEINRCSKSDLSTYTRALEQTRTSMLSVFAWFGSIQVPWNQFRDYELVPETILLTFSTDLLIQELESRPLTFQELEGAGRYFSGWNFDRIKSGEAKKLPPALKRTLWGHVLSVGNPVNIDRARPVFL